MWELIKKHKDEITAVSAVLGVVVSVAGFTIAWIELRATQRTVVASQQAIRAANAYQIQADARDTIGSIERDVRLSKYLQGDTSIELDEYLQGKLWMMFNFYLSVYRQDINGGLAEGFLDAFKSDFCAFMTGTPAGEAWDALLEKGRISTDYEVMRGTWCP